MLMKSTALLFWGDIPLCEGDVLSLVREDSNDGRVVWE